MGEEVEDGQIAGYILKGEIGAAQGMVEELFYSFEIAVKLISVFELIELEEPQGVEFVKIRSQLCRFGGMGNNGEEFQTAEWRLSVDAGIGRSFAETQFPLQPSATFTCVPNSFCRMAKKPLWSNGTNDILNEIKN